MRKLCTVMFSALVLCSMVGCKKGEEVAEEPLIDVEASTEAIKTWFDQYTSSIKAGDVDSLLALYAENIVILPPNGSIVEGRDAYRQWISGWFGNFNAEEKLEIQEIKILGRNAFVRGSHNYRNIHKETGVTKEGKGTFINFFELQSDGMWKCTHNMWTIVSPPHPEAE
jgi:ketosteroid isomerase-like protein